MGKSNSRQTRKKAGTGASRAAGSLATPLSAVRAARAIEALTPAFVRWLDDGSAEAAGLAMDSLAVVQAVMASFLEATPAAEVTGFEPQALAEAIDDVLDGATDEDSVLFVLDSMHAYVDFLADTQRWHGSDGQLAGVHALLDYADAPDLYGLSIRVPELDDGEAFEFLSGLPLIQRAASLLRWLGSGRPVTRTGALRLIDLKDAAECVGILARGAVPEAASTQIDPMPPAARSMKDVPLLRLVWDALAETGLIAISSTKASPTKDAAEFMAGSQTERLEGYTSFVTVFLRNAVLRVDPARHWENGVTEIELAALVAAMSAEPPSVERMLAAEDYAPEDEKLLTGLSVRLALQRLEMLAALGLVEMDSHIRVPPAIVACMADAFDGDGVVSL